MLLSRVADSLYWISRYLERAEHTSRLISVRLELGLDRHSDSDTWDFSRLFGSLRFETPVPTPTPNDPGELIATMVFDTANRESVASCITAARENARQVREEISSEMWERLNELFLHMRQLQTVNTWAGRPHFLFRSIIDGVHLFQGTCSATMARGEGWQYLEAGRFLERASATAALLDLQLRHRGSRSGSPHSENPEWVGLLRSCTAFEAYCRHYTADVRFERIAEFLLLNQEFPRSVRFAAARVESALRAVEKLTSRGAGGRAERLAGRLHASLDYGQVDEILGEDPHAYLASINRYCGQIHTALYQHYISYPIESAVPA